MGVVDMVDWIENCELVLVCEEFLIFRIFFVVWVVYEKFIGVLCLVR